MKSPTQYFEPLLTKEKITEIEEVAQSYGVARRATIATAGLSSHYLVEEICADFEMLEELLEQVQSFKVHLKQLSELADHSERCLLQAGQIAISELKEKQGGR